MNATFLGKLSFPVQDVVSLRAHTKRPASIYQVRNPEKSSGNTSGGLTKVFLSVMGIFDKPVSFNINGYTDIPRFASTYRHDAASAGKAIDVVSSYIQGSPTVIKSVDDKEDFTINPGGRLEIEFNVTTPYFGIVSKDGSFGTMSLQMVANREIAPVVTDREWFSVFAKANVANTHSLNEVVLGTTYGIVAEQRPGWPQTYSFRRESGSNAPTAVSLAEGSEAKEFSFSAPESTVSLLNPKRDIYLDVTLA